MSFKQILLVYVLSSLSSPLWADEYHYQDLIVGERAAGLGGAYISISDDPSGLYHNPAGIIYNFENYFSLSANVYKTSKTTYKKTIFNQDYTMQSSGWVPNFFGATQNSGKFKYGFAILSPSTEVLDFDDKITGVATANEPKSIRRRLMRQYSVSLYGVGAAYEPIKDFATGLSLFLGQLTDKTINTLTQISNGSPDYYIMNENFVDQTSLFLYPKFGVQWMPAQKWALGATASTSYTLYSNKKTRTLSTTECPADSPPATCSDSNAATNLISTEGKSEPKVLSPYEFGVGTSYFPTKSLLFSFDLKYFTNDPEFTNFTTIPVLNFSFGTEWFVNDRIVLRGGLYSNNANTPQLVANKINQPEHVDYLGMTAGITFESPGSSFTLCTQFSQGNGKGQVLSGRTEQQEIEATTAAIYITASYQL